jgi:hypothetical protein
MSRASCTAHIANLIDDLADLYLAQVADLGRSGGTFGGQHTYPRELPQ